MRRLAMSWSAVAVAVLAVVTAVLAVAALRGPGGLAGAAPGPTGSALTDPPKLRATSPTSGRPVVEPPLVIVDELIAYRGETGSCIGGAELERTDDGGRHWEPVVVPADVVLQLRATSATKLDLVGANASCEPALFTTTDQGLSFRGPAPADDLWFRLPDTTKKVASPVGVVDSPCPDKDVEVVELDGVSPTEAAALCSTDDIVFSADGGTQWSSVGEVSNAVALAWESRELGWVLQAGTDACAGYQLMRTDNSGANWTAGGCVGDATLQDAEASPPSLSFASPSLGMARVGKNVFVTQDSGNTWTPQ